MRAKKIVLSKIDKDTNVFKKNLTIKVNRARKDHCFRNETDKKTGENFLLPLYNHLEDERYTRLFISPERRKIIAGMSSRAIRLFQWLQYEIETNIDYVWINETRYLEENNIATKPTLTQAIDELIRYGIIAPVYKKPNTYWINPAYLFNGNRIQYFPRNLDIKED